MKNDDRTKGSGQRIAFDPNEHRMIWLAKTFPALARLPELVEPWEPHALDEWAAVASHGERLVVQFLLAVWNPAFAWRCGQFDMMEALRTWDEAHREAFIARAAEPWWP